MDISESYDPLNKLIYFICIFGFIITAVSVFAAVMIARSFTKPIDELVHATKEWSSGNLLYKVQISTKDELGDLANAFNEVGVLLENAKSLEKEYGMKLSAEVESKTQELISKIADLDKVRAATLNMMEDLSESNKHLKDLDEAKTNFLNTASHELKTPLTAISAYLDVLEDYRGEFNKEQLQGLDAIKRNSNQLKVLINNILELSRIESGRFELNKNEVNVEKKIFFQVENLRILAANKNIELQAKVDKLPIIMTDELRLEEILNNLIGNAIKFTNKGVITVEAKQDGDFISISVIDTGVGIPKDKLDNLFQKFYQVDSTLSRKYGGTGLGLVITKKLVEAQGGSIKVESNVGIGSNFTLRLPINKKIDNDKIDNNKINDDKLIDSGKKIDDKVDTTKKSDEK